MSILSCSALSTSFVSPRAYLKYCIRFVLLTMLTWAFPCAGTAAEEGVVLSPYSCSDFLQDIADPADGSKLLRSMMMISWAAGYVAAHQEGNPKADVEAVRIAASALGDACRGAPKEQVVPIMVRFVSANLASPKIAPGDVSPNPLPGFATYENHDLFGGDLQRSPSRTLATCSGSCGALRDCLGFSFDRWNRACFLKSRLTAMVLDPTSTAGIRSGTAKPQLSSASPRIVRRSGKVCRGSVFRTMTSAKVEDCERACMEESACIGFTFRTPQNACAVFSSVSELQSQARAISGLKMQRP
ncbi:MAG: hypothetical protein QOF41_427 [Methylobacteriaceae bacterium]|nr:hypothetical protein [Methylobacteriaceae bacterium]